ncbi:hypothetical protein ACJMK2_022255 [Sinanodonta woodiana]|uniref:Peptidase M12B domain-containing protein n=1 Tax=Sinanodonta woodiana TaxID=1069815 RepID=A0ABD3TKG7_SINWO
MFILVEVTTSETVWVRDATEKRTPSNIDLPDELAFQLTRRSETLNLNLRRNHDINPHAGVYFARQLKNGKFGLEQSNDIETENLVYYQDIHNWAFMTVRCVRKAYEQCNRTINGNVRIEDIDYVIHPAENDASSRNLLEVPDVLGRQYVLEVERHPIREHSFDNQDTHQEMETNIGEKRVTIKRRFQKQQNQKRLSAALISMPDTKESTVQKNGEIDKSRQLPQIYYVKVAEVIDLGLWNFYYSTVNYQSPLTRKRDVIKCIHQFYSHIMNGINMLYKGIRDRSIRISVILNKFIILKTDLDFQHNESKVNSHNGTMYIEGFPYLKDVIDWDIKSAENDEPSFSLGMLFTKYKLYNDVFENNDGGGLCYTGEVCNKGKRMSIVEMGSYVWTVRAAAHEMGHSLGADHDGEKGSVDCKADDEYIMSPHIDDNYPGRRYSRNPWIFSHCSINAFKRTLPSKTCLSDAGSYFDYDDYHAFVKNEPGMYRLNHS